MSKTTRRPQLTEAEKAERQAAIQAIHDELEAKFAALTTSEEWTEALAFAAKFYRYSFGNTLWLMMQAAERGFELSHVASFKSFKEMGRSVRKGETSLRVLAPCKYKITETVDGREQERWIVKGYKAVPVFDISQTDGPDVPELAPTLLTEGGELEIQSKVVELIKAQGFSFELETITGGANGYTNHELKRIAVRDDVELAQRIKTSIHELAHAMLHAPENVNYHSNRARCEVEAESVAYVVMTHLGITAEDYSLPYVASWSGGDVKLVKATAETVIKTARAIIDQLDNVTELEVAA